MKKLLMAMIRFSVTGFIFVVLFMFFWSAQAAPVTKEIKPQEIRLKIIGDKIVPVNSIGVPQYHKQQYKSIGNRICPIDSLGNVQAHKPCLMVIGVRKIHGNTAMVKHLPISQQDWEEAERLVGQANQEALSEMLRAIAILNEGKK